MQVSDDCMIDPNQPRKLNALQWLGCRV